MQPRNDWSATSIRVPKGVRSETRVLALLEGCRRRIILALRAVDGALFLGVGGIRKRIDSGCSLPEVYACIVQVERNRLSEKS